MALARPTRLLRLRQRRPFVCARASSVACFALVVSARASSASFFALMVAALATVSWRFFRSRAAFARDCTAATAARPIRPASSAAAAPVTAVRWCRAHRRARADSGSRQAETGSSAIHRSMSSASARHEP